MDVRRETHRSASARASPGTVALPGAARLFDFTQDLACHGVIISQQNGDVKQINGNDGYLITEKRED